MLSVHISMDVHGVAIPHEAMNNAASAQTFQKRNIARWEHKLQSETKRTYTRQLLINDLDVPLLPPNPSSQFPKRNSNVWFLAFAGPGDFDPCWSSKRLGATPSRLLYNSMQNCCRRRATCQMCPSWFRPSWLGPARLRSEVLTHIWTFLAIPLWPSNETNSCATHDSREEKLYAREGIAWDPMDFPDNQDVFLQRDPVFNSLFSFAGMSSPENHWTN